MANSDSRDPITELEADPRFTEKQGEREPTVEVTVPVRTFGRRDHLPPRVRELMDGGLSEHMAREAAAVEQGMQPG